MKNVRDKDGRHYLLLKRSKKSALVRDPETGEERYLESDALEPADGESPLETVARQVDSDVRQLLTAVHDDQSLGLLLEVATEGPLTARTIIDRTDFCESDLVGRLTTFRAAGLLAETTVYGEPGYEATETCRQALEVLSQK